MAWRSGSLSRTLLNTARSPAIRPSAGNATAIPRSRRPASPLLSNAVRPPRTFSFTNPRTVEVLGCVQSLMPLHSVMADASLTSHIAVSVRAWCELSQGTFRRTCQDR